MPRNPFCLRIIAFTLPDLFTVSFTLISKTRLKDKFNYIILSLFLTLSSPSPCPTGLVRLVSLGFNFNFYPTRKLIQTHSSYPNSQSWILVGRDA